MCVCVCAGCSPGPRWLPPSIHLWEWRHPLPTGTYSLNNWRQITQPTQRVSSTIDGPPPLTERSVSLLRKCTTRDGHHGDVCGVSVRVYVCTCGVCVSVYTYKVLACSLVSSTALPLASRPTYVCTYVRAHKHVHVLVHTRTQCVQCAGS